MATLAVGRASRERLFYTGIAIAMFAAVFLGFARSFFLRPWFPDVPAPTETIFYVHGAVFTAWLVLLVVQPALVAVRRTDLHRKLGWLGAGLAVAMVALVAQATRFSIVAPSASRTGRWRIPHTDDTRFMIGSLSKAFTAVVLQLIQEGLSLDTPLSDRLPGVPRSVARGSQSVIC